MTAALKFTFAGTANARGVPCWGCPCPACKRARAEPGYQRWPACGILQAGAQTWLVDAADFRAPQHFMPEDLSGAFITHYHLDHVYALMHMRWGKGARLKVYGPDDPDDIDDLFAHPGALDFSTHTRAFQTLHFDDLAVTPLPLNHDRPCHGYLFERQGHRFAYLTDTHGLPDATLDYLREHRPEALAVDCNTPPDRPEPTTHNSLDGALAIHHAIKPERTLLTHIGHDLDSWLMTDGEQSLPADVLLAHDGMAIEF
ncbi:MAG: phosphonate metabolism protein PhnP [Gammaproteobacteria bacterium]